MSTPVGPTRGEKLAEFVARVAADDSDMTVAARDALGVDSLLEAEANAMAPPRPPTPPFDPMPVAVAAVDRYSAWVDSYPDGDPTPLRARERALVLARKAVLRLEGEL